MARACAVFDRRKRDRDIAAELDQHAAGTDRHDRPELRIAPHADEELAARPRTWPGRGRPRWRHRQAACERRHDLAPGVLEGAPLRQAELDGAHLALVHELPANGLERHRIADPLRRLDRPLERGAHLFAGDLDAVARDEALGLPARSACPPEFGRGHSHPADRPAAAAARPAALPRACGSP